MNGVRKEIIVTRQLTELNRFVRHFPEASFRVTECPTFSIRPVLHGFHLHRTFSRIREFDLAIFTSQAGVSNTMSYLREIGLDVEDLNRMKVYAVGPVTAQTLIREGVETVAIPRTYTAEDLADLFPNAATGHRKALFPRGDHTTSQLNNLLIRKGYEVDSPVVYRNRPNEKLSPRALRLLTEGDANCVAFTAPSAVKAMAKMLGQDQMADVLKDVEIASIGSVTSRAVESMGLRVEIQPEHFTLDHLAQAIVGFYSP